MSAEATFISRHRSGRGTLRRVSGSGGSYPPQAAVIRRQAAANHRLRMARRIRHGMMDV
ncbi:hypothetical protein GCM10010468_08810 [Actinocorallia longicatena]|uniref:Uncharacterized protein n=1 Tax=Actinocorallia longicatena TaxID=111803 RepID=A0ABP6Q2C1_9ACTN